MFRFVISSHILTPPRIVGSACKPSFFAARFFGTRPVKTLPDGFITVPEDKIHIDVRKFGRIDGICSVFNQ